MKQQVFYIHGGESYENHEDFLERIRTKDIWDLPGTESTKKWTSTFAQDLGENYEVFMPAMPNKQNASYEEWKIWFERHFEYLRDEVILVGHSLGAMFLTKYLSEEKVPFKKSTLILLSPAVYYFRDQETGEDGGNFNCDIEKLSNILKNVKNVILMHSKDDFVISYDHSTKFKELVPEAELITFEDKNHFLIEEFPELIGKIRGLS